MMGMMDLEVEDEVNLEQPLEEVFILLTNLFASNGPYPLNTIAHHAHVSFGNCKAPPWTTTQYRLHGHLYSSPACRAIPGAGGPNSRSFHEILMVEDVMKAYSL
jgi:hypothetical protein